MSHSQGRTRLKDEPAAEREPQPRRDWRRKFLACLAESSNVTQSAARANISLSRAYRSRREEPEFARQWLAALWEGYSHLEMEVLRRLRDGDQHTCDNEKYDFANAIRLLNAHRENAARAQAEHRSVSAAEIRAAIDRKVRAISQQVRRDRAGVSSKGSSQA
ncbi:MAG: hypothetical protein V2I27_09955 [Erythrobacter sp.]|jgi:hypothetical protein|nr:hypothetical protein [Erythrobacter sp.]